MTILILAFGIITALGIIMILRALPAAEPVTAERTDPEREIEQLREIGLGYAPKLAGAVRIPTVSYIDYEKIDQEAYRDFEKYLEKSFPRVHETLRKEKVGDYGLLYTWEGSSSGKQGDSGGEGSEVLLPILFLAHYDVVPVTPEEEKQWTCPPFSGVIEEGYLWGRGSLDDKMCLIALLESAERLLSEDFTPRRSFYFAFGGDEEVTGYRGARKIGSLLGERGLQFAFALDEGAMITEGIIPGLKKPGAMISLTEKGFCNIELITPGDPGHSAMPPKHTAVGKLAAAITEIEKNPFPVKTVKTAAAFFTALTPHLGFGLRLLFRNRFLFNPLVMKMFLSTPQSAAFLRTTQAVTTDLKHYQSVADNLYRFIPVKINRKELKRIHGIDERISLENMGRALDFYMILMKTAGCPGPEGIKFG